MFREMSEEMPILHTCEQEFDVAWCFAVLSLIILLCWRSRQVFVAPFQLALHSELLWPMPPALSYWEWGKHIRTLHVPFHSSEWTTAIRKARKAEKCVAIQSGLKCTEWVRNGVWVWLPLQRVCVLFVFPVFLKSVQLLGLASETANYAALNVVLTVSRIHIRLWRAWNISPDLQSRHTLPHVTFLVLSCMSGHVSAFFEKSSRFLKRLGVGVLGTAVFQQPDGVPGTGSGGWKGRTLWWYGRLYAGPCDGRSTTWHWGARHVPKLRTVFDSGEGGATGKGGSKNPRQILGPNTCSAFARQDSRFQSPLFEKNKQVTQDIAKCHTQWLHRSRGWLPGTFLIAKQCNSMPSSKLFRTQNQFVVASQVISAGTGKNVHQVWYQNKLLWLEPTKHRSGNSR